MMLLETPAATGREPTAASRWQRLSSQREVSLIAVLVVLVVIFSLLSGRFASWTTAAQVLNDMSIVVIVGAGLALVLLTRNIDVSVGSMVGLTAYLGATFSVEHPQLPMVAVIGYSCLIGLVLGGINGLIVATLRVPSIMVTLGTLYVYRGIDSAIAGSSQ